MAICVGKSGLSLGNLFAIKFAETLVNSGFMCIFDAWKGSKYQQIFRQKHYQKE
jgi:hypothetical protein